MPFPVKTEISGQRCRTLLFRNLSYLTLYFVPAGGEG
ncbi:hypothetical protein FBY58_0476 [Zymomonas mobilis]|uniref:Uncharacterized protein n=1 Tax=Zymomonas mobilis TaxID=542 RepID=A0A542W014_ZYMMB|nr:hypothetical protein FBY58_0476 [Zymomonas mobilis]